MNKENSFWNIVTCNDLLDRLEYTVLTEAFTAYTMSVMAPFDDDREAYSNEFRIIRRIIDKAGLGAELDKMIAGLFEQLVPKILTVRYNESRDIKTEHTAQAVSQLKEVFTRRQLEQLGIL